LYSDWSMDTRVAEARGGIKFLFRITAGLSLLINQPSWSLLQQRRTP
jgi:hypothetical protein